MFPLFIGLLSASAYAEDKEIRAGVCVSAYFTDCSIAGITVEYAQKSFSVGATISPIPATLMTHGKYYYDIKFARPFVGGNIGLYMDPAASGVLYGPSFGVDVPVFRFTLRGQGTYFFDSNSSIDDIQLGFAVLFGF